MKNNRLLYFVGAFVLGFGFLTGLWKAAGIDPQRDRKKRRGAVNSIHSGWGDWIRYSDYSHCQFGNRGLRARKVAGVTVGGAGIYCGAYHRRVADAEPGIPRRGGRGGLHGPPAPALGLDLFKPT